MKIYDLKVRTRELAHKCVSIAMSLENNYINRIYKDQLIRCSTSMAANYQAACIGQSPLSFISKLSISIEEADEVYFWLIFMIEEKILKEEQVNDVLEEAKSIVNILCKSRITARENMKKKADKS